MKTFLLAVLLASLCGMRLDAAEAQAPSMSFFVTSQGSGSGANLGGLEGADAHCQKLAAAAGAGDRTWRAYLSASAADGKPAVNAGDRIGAGPWHNAKGVKIADNVADLHSENSNINKETALDEKGNTVNAGGDTPNKHDILTGSRLDGTAYPSGEDMTCRNWTAGNATKFPGKVQLGHHDRMSFSKPGSPWNSAHASRGCGQEDLRSSGGDGLFYCFAVK